MSCSATERGGRTCAARGMEAGRGPGLHATCERCHATMLSLGLAFPRLPTRRTATRERRRRAAGLRRGGRARRRARRPSKTATRWRDRRARFVRRARQPLAEPPAKTPPDASGARINARSERSRVSRAFVAVFVLVLGGPGLVLAGIYALWFLHSERRRGRRKTTKSFAPPKSSKRRSRARPERAKTRRSRYPPRRPVPPSSPPHREFPLSNRFARSSERSSSPLLEPSVCTFPARRRREAAAAAARPTNRRTVRAGRRHAAARGRASRGRHACRESAVSARAVPPPPPPDPGDGSTRPIPEPDDASVAQTRRSTIQGAQRVRRARRRRLRDGASRFFFSGEETFFRRSRPSVPGT